MTPVPVSRHLVRAFAMAMAALSLAWGTTLSSTLASAVACAAVGVPVGYALGRSRLRLPVALGLVGGALFVALKLAALSVDTTFVASHLGPGTALKIAAAIRFGALALAGTAALRTLSARYPAAAALEVLALAAAIPTVFASHRDGVIARPLWLSDFAWQRGIDPTQIFLGVGAVAVAILAVLLLAESGSGRAASSFVLLAALTLFGLFLLPLLGMPTPKPPTNLGLTGSPDGGSGKGDGDAGQAPAPRPPELGDAGNPFDGGASPDGGDRADGGSDPLDGGPPMAESEQLDKDGKSGAGEAPMAVVLLDDDYSPPSQGYYLRQEAWSQFNGARLIRATRSGVDEDGAGEFPVAPTDVLDPPPPGDRALIHATVALLVEHTHPFAIESPTRFAPVKNPNPTRFVRAYRFESLAQTTPYKELFGRRAGNPAWSAEARAFYLEGPVDPRYAALAHTLEARVPAAKKGDPFATAIAVKLYLDDQFTYSTKHRHAGVADPTADFLFGDRTGYCVHFAHAAVYLWRALGIPARMGTGYRSEEEGRHGSSTLIVRASDAHAWPELYLEGAGWIVLDIAAKKTLDDPPPPVDSDMQRLLGEMARQLPPDPTSTGIEGVEPARYARIAARWAGMLALAVGVLLYVIKIWRRLAPWVVSARRLPRVGYRATLDMLAEVGLARRFGESREAFARRVGPLAPSFEEVTALHLAAALGDPATPASSRDELSRPRWRAGLRRVRAEIRGGARWWRRILGLLDPASFLRAR